MSLVHKALVSICHVEVWLTDKAGLPSVMKQLEILYTTRHPTIDVLRHFSFKYGVNKFSQKTRQVSNHIW